MPELDATSLASDYGEYYMCDGSDRDTSRCLKLTTGGLLYKTNGSNSYINALLADSGSLAAANFCGAVKTASFYMPPGSSTVVMKNNQGYTVMGLDLGGISYQISGASNGVFQVIQGTIVPYMLSSYGRDLDIWVYPPRNIFGTVTDFAFSPLFLVVGSAYSEYASSDSMRFDFGAQPYNSPFNWNSGTPYIKLRCRGGQLSKKIHYTLILEG